MESAPTDKWCCNVCSRDFFIIVHKNKLTDKSKFEAIGEKLDYWQKMGEFFAVFFGFVQG